jgi:hypothetical protein
MNPAPNPELGLHDSMSPRFIISNDHVAAHVSKAIDNVLNMDIWYRDAIKGSPAAHGFSKY